LAVDRAALNRRGQRRRRDRSPALRRQVGPRPRPHRRRGIHGRRWCSRAGRRRRGRPALRPRARALAGRGADGRAARRHLASRRAALDRRAGVPAAHGTTRRAGSRAAASDLRGGREARGSSHRRTPSLVPRCIMLLHLFRGCIRVARVCIICIGRVIRQARPQSSAVQHSVGPFSDVQRTARPSPAKLAGYPCCDMLPSRRRRAPRRLPQMARRPTRLVTGGLQ
jgi:hypothetical protein